MRHNTNSSLHQDREMDVPELRGTSEDELRKTEGGFTAIGAITIVCSPNPAGDGMTCDRGDL